MYRDWNVYLKVIEKEEQARNDYKAILFYVEEDQADAQEIKNMIQSEEASMKILDPKNLRLNEMPKYLQSDILNRIKVILLLSNNFLKKYQKEKSQCWSDNAIYSNLDAVLSATDQDSRKGKLLPIIIGKDFTFDKDSFAYQQYKLEHIYKLRYTQDKKLHFLNKIRAAVDFDKSTAALMMDRGF